MKTTTLVRKGVSTEMMDFVSRLVDKIPWPARRCAMGEVTLLLLDGKWMASIVSPLFLILAPTIGLATNTAYLTALSLTSLIPTNSTEPRYVRQTDPYLNLAP